MGIDSLDREKRALGRAMRRLREARRISQTDAAARMGTADQQWWRWEAGERAPRPAALPKIAEAIGVSVDELLETRRQVLESDRPAEAGASPDLAPLFGYAQGLADRLAVAPGQELRLVPRHPAQLGYKRAGVVEIAGEAMFPRWKPRELAYFVFDMTPARGDDVLIELTDGTGLVREYVSRQPDAVTVRRYSPCEELEHIPADQVRALHAIVG